MNRLDADVWRTSRLGLSAPPGLSSASSFLYRPLTDDDLRPPSSELSGVGLLHVISGQDDVARTPAIASAFPIVTEDHPEVAKDTWFAIALVEEATTPLFFVASAFPARPEVCWLRFFGDMAAAGFSSLNARLSRWLAPFALFLNVAATRGFVGIVTVPEAPEFAAFVSRFAFRALSSSVPDGGSLVPSGTEPLLTPTEALAGDIATFELRFERMRERVQRDAARRYAGRTALFVLDSGETYEVAFDSTGSLSWHRGEARQSPSVEMRGSLQDFMAISSKQLDAVTAVATGRIRVTGDLEFAEAFTRLFDPKSAESLS